jgi:hypothetical protein
MALRFRPASGLAEHLYFNIGRSSCTPLPDCREGTQFCFQNNSSSEEDDQIAIAWQAQLEMAHADPLRMRLCIFIIKARNRHLEDNKPGPDRPIKK